MKAVVAVRTGLAAAAAASLVYFIRIRGTPGMFQFDDAFMFVRYAKHFIAGDGFSWNVEDGPVYGPTSALHLIVVTVLRRVTAMSDAGVVISASTGAALLASAAMVALVFLSVRDPALRRFWVPLAAVPLLLTSRRFGFHSQTGMETMLSLLCNALVALSTVAFTQKRSRVLFALCVAAGYASYLARPDNGATALLIPPLFFVAADRRLHCAAAGYIVVFVVALAVDAFVKTRIFGDPIPLSFFAKRSGFYAGYLGVFRWNAAAYMLEFVAECTPWLVLLVLFADRTTAGRIAAVLLPVVVTFAYYLSVVQVMGFVARYYFPFVAFVMMAACVAIDGLRRDGALSTERRLILRRTIGRRLAAVGVLLLMTSSPARAAAAGVWRATMIGPPEHLAAAQRYAMPPVLPLRYVESGETFHAIASMLGEMPADTVFAASEYGYVGSTLASLTVVDLVGLNDRRVARQGFSADDLFSRQPDIIWFPHDDYSGLIKAILDSPTFAKNYEYYPGVFEFGLALNTASWRYAAVRTAVERAFARTYEGRRLPDYLAPPVAAGESVSLFRR
jgi:hypothetical protein